MTEVQDNLEYADGPLADQADWADYADLTGIGPINIDTNQARAGTTADSDPGTPCLAVWQGDGIYERKQSVTLTVGQSGVDRGEIYCALYIHGGGFYIAGCGGFGSEWHIDRIEDDGSGGFNKVDMGGTVGTDTEPAAATGDEITVTAEATNGGADTLLSLYKNGTLITSVTDSAFTAGGDVGLCLFDHDFGDDYRADTFAANDHQDEDDFSRSNQPLTDSSLWSDPGHFAGSLVVDNNQVKQSAEQAECATWQGAGNYDGYLRLSLLVGSDHGNQQNTASGPSLIGSDYIVTAAVYANWDELNLQRHQVSADDELTLDASGDLGVAWAEGDEVTLEAERTDGDCLFVATKNGDFATLIRTNQDASFFSGANPGIRMMTGFAGIDAAFDDWRTTGSDVSGPALTNPAANPGPGTVDLDVDTDVGNGRFFAIVYTASQNPPTALHVKAGLYGTSVGDDVAEAHEFKDVAATGTHTISVAGLNESTDYNYAIVHQDDSWALSTVTTGAFTTGAATGSVVSDSFNRSNQPLSDSADWSTVGWGSGVAPVIENNQIRGAAQDQGHAARWVGAGEWGRRQRARVSIGSDNEQANGASVAVYMGPHGSYHVNIGYREGELGLTRYNSSNDTYNSLDAWVWDTAPTSGDEVEIEVMDDGDGNSRLLARLNGTTVIDYTDESSNRHDGGSPGILMWSNTVRFGSFEAEAYGDVQLADPETSNVGESSADVSVLVDVNAGTLYMVVTESPTSPTKSQVKSGNNHNGNAAVDAQDQSIGSAGRKSFQVTGLSQSTAYYAYFMLEDSEGVQSDVVSTGRFVMEGKTVTFTVEDDQGNLITGESSIEYWVSDTRGAAPVESSDDGTTDSNGQMTLGIEGSQKSAGQVVIVEVKLADGRYGTFEAVVG